MPGIFDTAIFDVGIFDHDPDAEVCLFDTGIFDTGIFDHCPDATPTRREVWWPIFIDDEDDTPKQRKKKRKKKRKLVLRQLQQLILEDEIPLNTPLVQVMPSLNLLGQYERDRFIAEWERLKRLRRIQLDDEWMLMH